MKKEKIILSLATLFIGLTVAIVGFYIYESTRALSPKENKPLTKAVVRPTPKSGFFLSVDKPTDEEVFDKRIITVSGKTTPKTTILVYTQTSEQTAVSSNNGSFSTTITIDNGVNYLLVTAISSLGEEETVARTVSFTSEDF